MKKQQIYIYSRYWIKMSFIFKYNSLIRMISKRVEGSLAPSLTFYPLNLYLLSGQDCASLFFL